MNETTTLTPVDVYDSTRLPHYGAIDWDEGSETVELSAVALRVYEDSCAAWLATADDDGYLDDSTRAAYAVTTIGRFTVVRTGETYMREDMSVMPGDLRWDGMGGAAEEAKR